MSLEDDNLRKTKRAWVEMRREAIVVGMRPEYLKKYTLLLQILDDDPNGFFWAPYVGIRTLEEQEKLYNKGRMDNERIATNARPGDSAHNWGCAMDWAEWRPEYVGLEVWNKANWTFFGFCVRAAGFVWGGDWSTFIDKPHVELPMLTSWRRIGDVLRAKGNIEAEKFLVANIKKGEK